MLPDVVHLTLSQAKRQTASEKKKQKNGQAEKENQHKTMCFVDLKQNLTWSTNITTLFLRHVVC